MWKLKQRLTSQTEPELGIGIVANVDAKNSALEVSYPKAQIKRTYSLTRAPLRRFILQVGQKAFDAEAKPFIVDEIIDEDGLLKYISGKNIIWEYEVSEKEETQSTALSQFFSRHLSHFRAFDLRKEVWSLKSKHLLLPTKGLLGGRLEPIPHQLYIAWEVSQRIFPRVLLADEVGLGKTIEAGLVFSRLKVLGRAERVLVLVPPSLVHQWTAEMYRRFGELFTILDEERCSEDTSTLGLSSFDVHQKSITSLDFLASHPSHLEQALSSNWDLIIVDEAHKLEWSEEQPNALWMMVQALSKKAPGLILITATPHQRGTATQFGLLNLVDPSKFGNYDEFLEGTYTAKQLNACVDAIAKNDHASVRIILAGLFLEDELIQDYLKNLSNEQTAHKLTAALIDRHGTGRVYFRNRRQKIQGFPKRILHSVPLEPSSEYKAHLAGVNPIEIEDRFLVDYATGRGLKRTYDGRTKDDARFNWLKDYFAGLKEKVLIICSSQERVEKLAKFLDPQASQGAKAKVAVFHEGLSILERDLQAAGFAREDGAKALVCSEIGGEGRNFQFVRTLILFDLPMHPDLLEQRIGRLDRIGQGNEIQVIVPWQKDTPEEVLFKWYDQGLNAFSESWNGAAMMLEEYGERLLASFAHFFPSHPNFEKRHDVLSQLLVDTRETTAKIRFEMTDGIDSLVDANSFNKLIGKKLFESIDSYDDDTTLEFFIREVFDHYGVDYEDYDEHGSLLVKGGSLSFIEEFPLAKKEEDIVLTFNRRVALAREEMLFLTLDHPLIEATFDHMLYQSEGAASLCYWKNSPFGKGALIQLSLIMEAVGPKEIQLDRYFPVTIKTVVINHKGEPVAQELLKNKEKLLSEVNDKRVLEKIGDLKPLIMPAVEKVLAKAHIWLNTEKAKAKTIAYEKTQDEIARLTYLASVNPTVSQKEVETMVEMQKRVLEGLEKTHCRIDAIRVILTT